MDGQYTSISYFYDKLNSEVDYPAWTDHICRRLEENGIEKGRLVLDLACGTGTVALGLAEKGYDVIGVDLSAEMLNAAREKDRDGKVLWLLQDMTDFELYGTVGAIVCCLDSVNYILKKDHLARFFSLCRNYLDPDGILIFDVNSPYKFRNVYGNNHYILEDDGVYCGWKNYFNPKTGICDFELSFFAEGENGWERYDETQCEKMWSPRTLETLLKDNSFTIIGKMADLDGSPVDETSERIHYVCNVNK